MPQHLTTYFNDFLAEIRPSEAQRAGMSDGHLQLRKRLREDEKLKDLIVSTFLQGSYRRYTAVRPKGEKRSDVDIIVVTRMSEAEFTPKAALDSFRPFLEEHYKGKYVEQGRSFGIKLSAVDLDLVVTAAPSEAQMGLYKKLESLLDVRLDEGADLAKSARELPQWKLEPLRIPDRDANTWQPTHPLAQISWTTEKNQECGTHYVNVVKALKWWRVHHASALPQYPKGYPLEHLAGACCPDGIGSVAQGVVLTLEKLTRDYQTFASAKQVPYLKDHGVAQNVLQRLSGEEFAAFHARVAEAAKTARSAFDADDVPTAANLWRELFGDKFPRPPGGDKTNGGGSKGGFTPHAGGPSNVGGGRFANG